MPLDLAIGNGRLLVNFDAHYHLRDLYFPHVGQQNHTVGDLSRVGLWVDGAFTWLSDWTLELRYAHDTLVTAVRGSHAGLQLELEVGDAVDCRDNLLIRRFTLTDTSGRARDARLFVHFNPAIGESAYSNAAYYDGAQDALVCYKGDQYFLLASEPTLSDYAVGNKGSAQFQGTWRDAEDGVLSRHPTATGFVDLTLRCDLAVPAGGAATAYVWLAAGHSLGEVSGLHAAARSAPATLLDRTTHYWRLWLGRARGQDNFGDLSPAVVDLYRRSLLIVRTQIDDNGAILAANDSDIIAYGKDHYSYVWPRDAALVVDALGSAGYDDLARQYFHFLRGLLPRGGEGLNGYLQQRYTPTGAVAATWHPSVGEGRLRLPIQEDETALTVHALARYLDRTGDAQLLRDLYWDFVRPAADFILIYRDPVTGLPQPSYDLWEERYGISLFTCASVHAALVAAARLAEGLGEPGAAAGYRAGAEEVRAGVAEHFWDYDLRRFVGALDPQPNGTFRRDHAFDASMAGIFLFGLFPADDPRVVRTMGALWHALENRPPIGGIARRSADSYQHISHDYAAYPGNSWFVSTLWLADWLTASGDLFGARHWIEWCTGRALPSGTLAEQLHPETGAPLSVAPLTWSHAAFIASVERYLARMHGESQGGRLATRDETTRPLSARG